MIARIAAAVAAASIALAPTAVASPPAPPSPIIPPPVQPANIGDLKTEARAYYDSGAYLADLQQAAWPAIPWIIERTALVERPAVVFDIDETSLSNYEALEADDFGRIVAGPCELPGGPCGLQDWDLLAESTLIPPTMDVFNTAKDRGAAIFFITGRPESQRAATERNLAEVGYTGYARLIMKPTGEYYGSAADFKVPVRQSISADGYAIIANMGDQPSDLDGGFAEHTFLLPNPFYRVP
jgi:HAD superfamily, subfamily IIIB (Acid phosphatase)